jgi:hypothetical protein
MTDFADTRTSVAGRGHLTGMAASTVSAGAMSVVIGSTTVLASVIRELSPAVGDPVLVARVGSKYAVTGLLAASTPTSPEGPVADPAPRPSTVSGTLVVTPVETRTWRPSSWTSTGNDSTYQGEYAGYGLSTGVAFYGSKPRSLVGATVTSATVTLRRLSGGAYATQSTTLWRVTEDVRPSGAPTLPSSVGGPTLAIGETTDSPVPASWAQQMVDGTAGGLAVYEADGSPYVRLAGRADWSGAWALRIHWTR